jgi:hypothetical protein
VRLIAAEFYPRRSSLLLPFSSPSSSAARHRRPLPRLPPIVRLILGITLLLLGLGNLSCHLQEPLGAGPDVPAGQWVRTVDGWERTELWHAPPLHVPSLHPLVVAAGQALISVMGLVACAGTGRPEPTCQQP